MKIAIVGGGIAGATCAYMLRKTAALSISIFDMSVHGPGGRAATRRMRGYEFDHGCSFVAPPSPQFSLVQPLINVLRDAGVLKQWEAPILVHDMKSGECLDRYAAQRLHPELGEGFCGLLRHGPLLCGTPSSDATVSYLLRESCGMLDQGTRVTDMKWNPEACTWMLHGVRGAAKDAASEIVHKPEAIGAFDAVVLTDSAAFRQSSAAYINIDSKGSPGVQALIDQCAGIQHVPTFSLLLAFPQSLGLDLGAVYLRNHEYVSWIACDSSKPGRVGKTGHECWSALTTEEYARTLLQERPLAVQGKYNKQTREYLDGIVPVMREHFEGVMEVIGADQCPEPDFAFVHRWGAGFVGHPLKTPLAMSQNEQLVACGDFCLGSSVDAAMHSGMCAAQALETWAG